MIVEWVLSLFGSLARVIAKNAKPSVTWEKRRDDERRREEPIVVRHSMCFSVEILFQLAVCLLFALIIHSQRQRERERETDDSKPLGLIDEQRVSHRLCVQVLFKFEGEFARRTYI